MPYKTSSWKDKLPPESVIFIKAFYEIIDLSDEITEIKLSRQIVVGLREKGIRSFKEFYKNNNDLEFANKFIGNIADFMNVGMPFFSRDKVSELFDVKKQNLLREKIPPELSLWISFHLMNLVCMGTERKSMFDLLEEATNGNRESLFTLLRYDKTLFDHEWLREKIFHEAIVGNDIFFDKLGDAIKREPKVRKHRQSRLKLTLILFWKLIFSKLKYSEQMDLLNEAGFNITSENLYRRLVRTEIKPFFKQ